MKLTGARILLEELINHGVRVLFGYPGGSVLPIYDELYRFQGRLTHILTAHEQGAAHAADGYARVTGRAGVVLATSGPGATNLVTGIATAYLDSVPMIVLTGNVATTLLGKDSFQEVDTLGITLPIVKHSFIVTKVEDLEDTVKLAFQISESGRKGPVLIDLPRDVQTASCHYTRANPWPPRPYEEESIVDFENIVELIKGSERPFIYCGGGAVSADAGQEVVALSQKIHAPIGLSLMGVGAIPHSYPLNMGMTGMHGKYAASMLKSEADLIIAVGVRFSDRATGDKKEYSKKAKIVHIDIDQAEFHKNIKADFSLCGDVKKELRDIAEAVPQKQPLPWKKRIESFTSKQRAFDRVGDDFSPKNIIRGVHSFCNPDTPIATDVGQHQMWVVQHYPFQQPRTLLTSGGLGTMGFGMGAAMGACLAKGRVKTVLFTGDGSFGMNFNELATAVSENLPLVVIILNNGVLGMVRQWQTMFFDRRYSHTTLNRRTDFVKLAEALGARGFAVSTMEGLCAVLKGHFHDEGPLVIDCRFHRDEKVFPMIPPGASIKKIIVK